MPDVTVQKFYGRYLTEALKSRNSLRREIGCLLIIQQKFQTILEFLLDDKNATYLSSKSISTLSAWQSYQTVAVFIKPFYEKTKIVIDFGPWRQRTWNSSLDPALE